MSNLASLSNNLLHSKTIQSAANEKAATLVLLEHLAEIDRRRLYAIKGYSSLWEYIHKVLGYSEAQTSERVSAVRIMVKIPEVKRELAAGHLTLTSTAKLGAHARRENLAAQETVSLLHQVLGKSAREVERVLLTSLAGSNPSVKISANHDSSKAITPELTRITIEVDEEFLKLVEKMKNIKGNPVVSFQEVFKTAMKEYIHKREVKPTKPIKPKHAIAKPVKTEPLRAPEVRLTPAQVEGNHSDKTNLRNHSRYIPAVSRNFIRVRSGDRCEFTDPLTNRRCESKSGLQFDHIIPYAAGGQSTPDNLRHYCRTHNIQTAIQYFGVAKIQPYLKI